MSSPHLRTERQIEGAAEITFIDNGKLIRFVVPPVGPVLENEHGGMTHDERRRALEEARAAANVFLEFVSGELLSNWT